MLAEGGWAHERPFDDGDAPPRSPANGPPPEARGGHKQVSRVVVTIEEKRLAVAAGTQIRLPT